MALEDEKSVNKKEADSLPALKMNMGRMSYNGLSAMSGQVLEECNEDLRWPSCIETYKMMLKDSTISSTISLMAMDIAKVEWSVKVPEGYEGELESKAKFLESCMNDMTHSWTEFIKQASTFNQFGFSTVEKVYRKRVKSEGSRYNDGLYGIKELPLISQDSIAGWSWGKSGKQLDGLYQERVTPSSYGKVEFGFKSNEPKFIPRKKFLHFRTGGYNDSPIGVSQLNSVYVAWRYKTEMERAEALGVSSDVRGLKVIYIPPNYLSDSATKEEKETAEYFKKCLASIHKGEQSGVLLPQAYDHDGNKLFEFEVKSVMGSSSHNINDIILRLRKDIVVGLLAPMLTVGQDGSGSFALAEVLQNITTTVVEARLSEIKDQLNHDLVPQLFEINGWDTSVLPYFEFSRVDQTTVDDLGKYIQRVAAAGMLSSDADTANWIAEQVGMPRPFDDVTVGVEEVREQMTNFTSKSGKGLESGGLDGTSEGLSVRDNTTANLEN